MSLVDPTRQEARVMTRRATRGTVIVSLALHAAALDAVRQWRYEPPHLNGEPVAVLLTVTVHFGP